jgi:hypothetical protein
MGKNDSYDLLSSSPPAGAAAWLNPKEDQMYNLPNGEVTTDKDKYTKSWRKLAAPIEKATNSKCGAFDPGLLLFAIEKHDRSSLDLATHFAIKLYETLEGKAFKID